jgi:hypothetical protein
MTHARVSERTESSNLDCPSFLADGREQAGSDESWFAYLFALTDCSAFKVGFSCNPLQRIWSFSRRYFERFDLSQSVLLRVDECGTARALEASLKAELASNRIAAPTWVPVQAGGHTEWFSAVYFGDAEARLRATSAWSVNSIGAFDFFRAELSQVSANFEPWALMQAQRASDAWSHAQRGYPVRDERTSLRDWLDAYRYFDVPLFVDEPEILAYVNASAGCR